jgi:hypothetical protein
LIAKEKRAVLKGVQIGEKGIVRVGAIDGTPVYYGRNSSVSSVWILFFGTNCIRRKGDRGMLL